MLARKSVLIFCLLAIVKSELNACLVLKYDKGLKLRISETPIPFSAIIPGTRDEITDISEIFTVDYWFPIEINVPDAFMSAWQNIESAWEFASDYFSMSNGEMSPYHFSHA